MNNVYYALMKGMGILGFFFALNTNAQVMLSPTDDAFVRGDGTNVTNNYNTADLEVRFQINPDRPRYSFLKFSIPADFEGKEYQAVLEMWGTNLYQQANFLVREAENDWSETTVTFDTKPEFLSALEDIKFTTWNPAGDNTIVGELKIDVTQFVTGKEGEQVTLAILFDGYQNDDNLKLRSKESTIEEERPVLILTEIIKASGVELDKSSLDIEVGQSEQLAATVSPANANDKSVVWSSEDETIATVDQEGLVTAVAVGETKIKAITNDGGFMAEALVKITTPNVAVLGVELDKSTLDLFVEATSELIATVLPAEATDKTIVWSSEDESIVTVDQNGLITAVAVGETKVKVTTTDGGFFASTTVTVSAVVAERIAKHSQELSIYPNPFGCGQLSMHSSILKAGEKAQIEILAITGQRVYSKEVRVSNEGIITLRISGTIAPGVYLINLRTSEKTAISRLIVR